MYVDTDALDAQNYKEVCTFWRKIKLYAYDF